MHEKGKQLTSNSLFVKVNLILLLIMFFFLAITFANHKMLVQFKDNYNQSAAINNEILIMKETAKICQETITEFVRSENRINLSEHNEGIRNFENVLLRLQKTPQTAAKLSLLRSIDDSFYSYQTACNYAAFHRSGQRLLQSQAYLEESERINNYVQSYCEDYLQITILESKAYFEYLDSTQYAWSIINILFIISLVLLMLSSVVYFNSNVMGPLHELYSSAEDISKGNFARKASAHSSEKTISRLIDTFNLMAENTTIMMREIKERAILEKDILNKQLEITKYKAQISDAKLQALQSQINPHFLFNTLNSISRTIMLEMKGNAIMMLEALASLLRHSLSISSRSVKLEEELNIIREYLKIQEYRFADRIKVEIIYDEKLVKNTEIPPFILQPIVENAMIHGIEPKLENGKLTIEVVYIEGSCIISITDNGVGFDEETLKRIKKQKISKCEIAENPHDSIGLNNTYQRLKAFTKKDDCLQIESVKGQFTKVQIFIPKG